MPAPSIILFDDSTASLWEPFALTRPAGELIFGALTLRERAERVLGGRCVAHLAAGHLVGFQEEGAPPVLDHEHPPTEGDRIFWLSRAVPDWGERRDGAERPASAGAITLDGRVVGWYAPEGSAPPPSDFLRSPTTHAPSSTALALAGRLLERVWDLVSANTEQITRDVEALHPGARTPRLPDGVFHWGGHPLIFDDSVRLEPGCAFDTSDGPIWLDRGARVRAFTRLCGPAYVGPRSEVLGGSISCVSLGPVSKIRGEVSSTVCLGYTNKQHDGHLGHAYLGRWVNLGAETTNSDLKNDYGAIDMWTPEGVVDTGEMKLGCLLGDHVKTGIGLLLNTGTVVGAGSNLYGAQLPPKFVPPFSWGSGADLVEYRLDRFLKVAEVAMGRREVALTDAGRDQLRRAWERSARWREPGGRARG